MLRFLFPTVDVSAVLTENESISLRQHVIASKELEKGFRFLVDKKQIDITVRSPKYGLFIVHEK